MRHETDIEINPFAATSSTASSRQMGKKYGSEKSRNVYDSDNDKYARKSSREQMVTTNAYLSTEGTPDRRIDEDVPRHTPTLSRTMVKETQEGWDDDDLDLDLDDDEQTN